MGRKCPFRSPPYVSSFHWRLTRQTGSSPFDTGLTSIQTLFTGTIAKVSSLIAIVLGGYAFAHGEPGAKEDSRRSCGWHRNRGDGHQHPDLALGFIAPWSRPSAHASLTREGLYDRTHTKTPEIGVYKALHKPLTYLGVERTVFYFVCVGAVGAFNLLNSLLAGAAVFVGGYIFGRWITTTDPAFLKIMGKSERFKLRYDAAKQQVPNVEIR